MVVLFQIVGSSIVVLASCLFCSVVCRTEISIYWDPSAETISNLQTLQLWFLTENTNSHLVTPQDQLPFLNTILSKFYLQSSAWHTVSVEYKESSPSQELKDCCHQPPALTHRTCSVFQKPLMENQTMLLCGSDCHSCSLRGESKSTRSLTIFVETHFPYWIF